MAEVNPEIAQRCGCRMRAEDHRNDVFDKLNRSIPQIQSYLNLVRNHWALMCNDTLKESNVFSEQDLIDFMAKMAKTNELWSVTGASIADMKKLLPKDTRFDEMSRYTFKWGISPEEFEKQFQ